MRPNHGLQEFKRRFRWRNGPGMAPIALALWAVIIGSIFLLAGC